MFTGLVETAGRVTEALPQPPGLRLTVDAREVADGATLGASICVSGCCLSVVAIDGPRLSFELGPETLARTTLGRLAAGDVVNLERSLRLSDRLGGHLVTGHVDAVGRLRSREASGEWVTCRFDVPAPLLRHLAPKGSVALDGVSLTVVDVDPAGFSVALIPHTLAVTTLGALEPGAAVNVETDLMAKYAARWLDTSP
jgi:riboflavin synthase